MKKVLMFLALVCAFTGVWATGSADGKAAAGKKVELTVWDFKYDEAAIGPIFKTIDEDFMKANPGVVINHVAQPHDNYYEVIRSALASGTGPDVLLLHADQRATAVKDALLPLDTLVASWKSEVADSSWAATSVDGKIYGVPYTNQGIGFYYNKDLFKKAGLNPDKAPVSWNDFLAACESLKKAGIVPIVSGNASPCFTSDFIFRALVANFYGDSVKEFTKEGKASYADKEYRAAAGMIDELQTKGYLDPNGGSINYFMDAIDGFKAGKGAIFVGLTSDIAHWKDFEDAIGMGKVGYFPNINHPDMKYKDRQVVQGAGIQWSVTKASKNQAIAAKYIEAYTRGAGAQLFMEKTGAIVPNKNINVASTTYKLLPQILTLMGTNGVKDYSMNVPVPVYNGWVKASELFFVARSISVDEYVKLAQESYTAARK